MHTFPFCVQRTRLFFAVGAAFGLTAPVVHAGIVTGSDTVVTVPSGTAKQTWTVRNGAHLIFADGVLADRTTVDSFGRLDSTGASIVASSRFSALGLIEGASAALTDSVISNDQGAGIALTADRDVGYTPASVSVSGGSVTGTQGATVSANGALSLDRGAQLIGTTGFGATLFNGSLSVAGGSIVTGGTSGIGVSAEPRDVTAEGTRTIVVDNATVRGLNGSAIDVQAGTHAFSTNISLNNGALLESSDGVALAVDGSSTVDLGINGSAIVGDVVVQAGGLTDIDATAGASLAGRLAGVRSATFGAGSTWQVTGDSDVQALALAGTLAFATSALPHAVIVHGDYAGADGTIRLNTDLNAGGALSQQTTDRLLIEGNVSGTTLVEVADRGGNGALTDVNQDGVVGPSEGISLIQVKGSSTADAFRLSRGYIAAGPYQYTLHAFDASQLDASQSLLAGGIQWDYRLGNRYVCEGACKPEPPVVDPGTPDPDNPGNPGNGGGDGDTGNPGEGDAGEGGGIGSPDPVPGERIAVVPQVPSYLSAPVALLNYGDAMTDGLHQRLGDIRQAGATGALGGEMFARYLGGQHTYTSNRSFEQYGYDFDQQINALQVGGSVLAFDTDGGSLRAGFAVDKGTTRVTPKAADGASYAKYDANGVSGWVTWQHGSGFWVDAVVGSIRYGGTVSTELRGSDVARLHATGWTGSVEAGLPIALGGEWTLEPRFMLSRQAMTFRDMRDADGLDVHLGTAARTTGRLGARIERTANPLFMPYARIDLSATTGGTTRTDVSSTTFGDGATFSSGRGGNAYHVAAGATSQLTKNIQLYGEGTYEHYTGGFGMRGWAGNLGLRVSF